MTTHDRANEHKVIAHVIKSAKKKMFARSREGMDLRTAGQWFELELRKQFDDMLGAPENNDPSKYTLEYAEVMKRAEKIMQREDCDEATRTLLEDTLEDAAHLDVLRERVEAAERNCPVKQTSKQTVDPLDLRGRIAAILASDKLTDEDKAAMRRILEDGDLDEIVDVMRGNERSIAERQASPKTPAKESDTPSEFDPRDAVKELVREINGTLKPEPLADMLYTLIIFARDRRDPVDNAIIDGALEGLLPHTTKGRAAADKLEAAVRDDLDD